MKNILRTAAATFAAVAFAATAVAGTITVTMDPIGPLEYATFPQNYDVTGTLSHTPNVTSVNLIELYINGVLHTATPSPFSGSGTVSSAPFSLPWTITGPGTYDVEVVAYHGGHDGSDSEEVIVTETEIVVPVAECPAAPAVANHYMKDLGLKANSKQFKNVISLVALHMGPQTLFDGFEACDTANYEAAVHAFVDANLNTVAK